MYLSCPDNDEMCSKWYVINCDETKDIHTTNKFAK